MNKIITNNQLLAIIQDLHQIQRNNPGLWLLVEPRANRFREQNRMRIDAIDREMERCVKAYVKADADGKPILVKNEQGGSDYAFDTPLDESKYMRDMDHFMQKTIQIHV